jgi:4-hydroxythreonine-4-phosphate dehydrogenase
MRGEGEPGRLDAVVTGPICKASWDLAGKGKYPGHTEMLAARTKARRAIMLFDSPRLRVALATVHVALMDIRNVLTIGRVYDPIDLGWRYCRGIGIENPRVAVCGLNPHAGEGGLFGDEEERLIEPAIRTAREQGIDVVGPLSGDTVFMEARDGKYDLVVAMYHDQGLIPVKLLAFESAVNVTLGLPIVRTSPDHGTAFGIVGRNFASAEPMKSAVRLAAKLAAAPVGGRTDG